MNRKISLSDDQSLLRNATVVIRRVDETIEIWVRHFIEQVDEQNSDRPYDE